MKENSTLPELRMVPRPLGSLTPVMGRLLLLALLLIMLLARGFSQTESSMQELLQPNPVSLYE